MFGWCQYKPTDEVEPYGQGEVKTGFYYIECENSWPFHGNGWYADIFIHMALNFKLITKQSIIYQLCPKYSLASCFFINFIDTLAKKFKKFKQALVGFIGILEKHIQLMRSSVLHNTDHE